MARSDPEDRRPGIPAGCVSAVAAHSFLSRYTYLGDRQTRADLCGVYCNPVFRPDGKCVVSIRMATALVELSDGTRVVVARRRLRLNSK